MHPDSMPGPGSAASPAPKKRRFWRWIVRVALALVVAVALAAAVAAWLVPDPADHNPWRFLPGDAVLAVDINGSERIIARLAEDRVFAALDKAATEVPEVRRFQEPLAALEGFLSANPTASRFLLPRRAIVVFFDSRPPAVLLALPKAPRALLAMYGRFFDTVHLSGDDIWHFTVRDGWLVASASNEALRSVLSAWGKPAGAPGGEPRRDGEYVALAFRRPEPEARGGEENVFLVADPFAEQAAEAAASPGVLEGGKRMRVIAVPEPGGWAIRGIRDAADAAENPAAPPETILPEFADFGDAPPHGHLRLLVDMGSEQRRIVKLLASGSRPRRGHPWAELGKLWLEKGWLAHAGGRFSALASAEPGASLPSLRLKWDVRGNDAEAAGDFAAAFGLWMRSLSAPGGQPLAQSLRSALDYVEYSDDQGRGGVLSPPGGLLSGLNLEWKFAGGPERRVGEMALARRGTEIGGETPYFTAWRDGDVGADMFAMAAEWNATDAMLDNGVGIWRLVAPLLFGEKERGEIGVRLKLARLFAACYPAGSLTASHEEDALRFVVKIRNGEN